MKKPKTHRAVVITSEGKRRKVSMYQTALCWVVKPREFYYLDTGVRVGGSQSGKGRIIMETIEPIEV